MSYQVLARKWRPRNFTQVAGQVHVLKSLINALDNQRLHHAYLFTGTRGVGKTTLARILAKCLNCETGISSQPCDQCDSCIEINEGRFIDLIEVDAASRTKVEDTRELLENVQYMPSRGRFKIFLIDEVHMLSNHSFNALLKTLEEPPSHVKFLFATTDPQKLPVTILSRCLQFNLKNLSPQLITEYLASVLEKEKIESDEDALWQIAAAAAGSMRDALTLVDQAISYCQGKITADAIVEMLGIPEQQQVYALLNAMESGNIKQVIKIVHEMIERTPDYIRTLDSLLSVLHRIAIAQVLPEAADNSFGDKQQILDLALKLTAEDVQLYYQMGLKGREDLRLSGEMQSAFEMLILRMMVFSPNYIALDQVAQSQDANAVARSETSNATVTSIEKKKNKVATTEAVTVSTTDIDIVESNDLAAPLGNDPDLAQCKNEDSTQRKMALSAIEELTHDRWLEVYSKLGINGIAANVLANTELKKSEHGHLYFILDQSQSAVYSEDLLPKLSQAISDFYNIEVHVQIEIGETQKETPALLSQRLKRERHAEMVSEFEQDENVQELLKHFSGTLAKDSIAPVND